MPSLRLPANACAAYLCALVKWVLIKLKIDSEKLLSELTFPFQQAPEPGALTKITSGVYWLRMPLPLALDHINLYLLEDHDGWWIIDTGIKSKDTQKHWQTIFDTQLRGKPIKAVLATHMHPDHIGQAGWLCDRWRVPFYMSLGEYFSALSFTKTTAKDLSWQAEDYFRSTGLDDDFFVKLKAKFSGFQSLVEPLPTSYRRLEEGQQLTINGRQWRVIIGSGHSPEHVCLYCQSLDVLLSGDQLIANISSNVSVMAVEPEANPLDRWLQSLTTLKQFADSTLILPAHKLPFRGAQARVAQLQQHHATHLQALINACVDKKTAVQLLPVLFKRKLDSNVLTMALGECVAHLRYLCAQQRLQRFSDDNGVDWYQSDANDVRAIDADSETADTPLQV